MHAVQQHELQKNIITGTLITFLLIVLAVTTWLIPLPMLYYRVKLGRKNSLIIPAVVTLISVALSRDFSSSVMIYAGLMFLGFLLGELIETRVSIEKTILIPGIILMVAGSIVLLFYSNVTGTGIYESISVQMDGVLNTLHESGLVDEFPEELKHIIIWSIPGITAVLVLFISWVNVLLAGPIFKRGGLAFPDFGPLTHWKAPEQCVWCAIAGGAGLLLPVQSLGLFSINIIMVLSLIYFFQGVAIVLFYMNKMKFSVPLKVFLCWLVLFQFPVNMIVSAAGLFDMWINFRRLDTTTGNTGN